MTADFERALEFVLRWEGGYVNDPEDPGGETKYGISKRAYPNLDIKNLTLSQAKEIYYRDYWLRAHCPEVPPHIRLMHFDTAVNMGVRTATKCLQYSVGARVDGVWGKETAEKLPQANLYAYAYYRIKVYCTLVIQNNKLLKFLKGWLTRVNEALYESKKA